MGNFSRSFLLPRTESRFIVTNSNTPAHYQSNPNASTHHVNSSDNLASASQKAELTVPRLLDRSRGLHQSTGKLYVKKRIEQGEWYTLYGYDWFHSLVDAPTSRIITILLVTYVTIVAFFGVIYYWIRRLYYCDMNFDTYMGAFDLSLEVMATFGFSTTIDHCVLSSVAVLAQSCVRLIVESITIGILYSRFARPSGRASTVLFSNQAVIRRIRGKLYFMFQLCELRKHQLVEAHVRLYMVKRENDGHATETKSAKLRSLVGGAQTKQKEKQNTTKPIETYIQTCSMRLNHPNDELGGMLLLMMPQVVVHELDSTSPLMPPPIWRLNHPPRRAATAGGGSKKDEKNAISPMVRWNPPAYRRFLRVAAPHGRPDDGTTHYEYDADILSNMAFPNVHRRGADVDVTPLPPPHHHFVPPPPLTTMHHYPPRPTPSSVQQTPNNNNNNKSADTTYAAHIPSHQKGVAAAKTNQGSDKSVNSSSSSVWMTATVNTPIPLTSPRPASKPDLLLSSRAVLQETLLSPGLERYEGHLQTITEDGPNRTLTAQDGGGLRRRKNHAKHLLYDEDDEDDDYAEEHIASASGDETSNSRSRLNSGGGNKKNKKSKTTPRSRHQRTASPEDDYRLTSYQSQTDDDDDDHGDHVGTASQGNKKYHRHRGHRLHDDYTSSDEDDAVVVLSSHEDLEAGDGAGDDDIVTEPLWQREEREMIQRYLQDRRVEIIAVVEGIDAATGGNVQARHSYVASEIAWNQTFAYCLYEDPHDKLPTVDFELFHELVDASTDAAFCGPLPSVI